MIHETIDSLARSLAEHGLTLDEERIAVRDEELVRESGIDHLVRSAVFSPADEVRIRAREAIHELARELGAVPASIKPLYDAMGRGEVKGFTVPAFNIRALTYDSCRAVFRAAMRDEVGAFILEIARSEIGYTEQRPAEYSACVLAAAVKEGYRGPVFIQGDHFQASPKKWPTPERESERKAIEGLIDEAISAEFYNIDIDTSTLVDLSHPTLDEQQRENYENCARFTEYIRDREPEGISIAIGGEIGEVGHHNTSPEEFRAYMEGYQRTLRSGVEPIGKVSIQTGTSHGGVPMADGSIAQVKIDFGTLQTISRIARSEYGMAGAVQHGASTLPDEVFDEFPRHDTAEIHLATGFQNMILDHPEFPEELRDEMTRWVWENGIGERKSSDTDEQFVYKTRKKALGPFKQRMWDMPEDSRAAIVGDLEAKFAFLMRKLGVPGTRELVNRHVRVTAGTPRPKRDSTSPVGAMAFVNEGEGE